MRVIADEEEEEDKEAMKKRWFGFVFFLFFSILFPTVLVFSFSLFQQEKMVLFTTLSLFPPPLS